MSTRNMFWRQNKKNISTFLLKKKKCRIIIWSTPAVSLLSVFLNMSVTQITKKSEMSSEKCKLVGLTFHQRFETLIELDFDIS